MSDPPSDLDSFEFTFESYLDYSTRMEADPNPHLDDYDTLSLTESVARHQEEFGRTYHAYRSGSYHFPNDPTEAERLDEQHQLIKTIMDGRNYLAPLSRRRPPRRMLDIATGTGTWAVEMGDDFPDTQVVGTDLSPIQPSVVPPNVMFIVEDSSEEWCYSDKFDYIHCRVTIGCWADMKQQIIQQAFDNLEPGGMLECQECLAEPSCDDGTMRDDFAYWRWSQELITASAMADRQLDVVDKLKHWLGEVGFVDVHESVFKIPFNTWPKDRRLKHVGLLWQRNLMAGLSGFSLGLFNRMLGRTVEEIEVNLVGVRNSLYDKNVHAYTKLVVVWGRKPKA